MAASFCLSAAMFGNKIREVEQNGDGDAIQLDRGTWECPVLGAYEHLMF